MTETKDLFRVEIAQRVATLTLDRPPLNILDKKTLEALTEKLRELAQSEEVGALVLAGAGKAFCAGVDVGEHRPPGVGALLNAFHTFCRDLLDFPRPTLARVQGAALGGGCELVLCCDLAVAATGAQVGQPEVTLGVLPPVASVLLPRMAGWRKAAQVILWGEIFQAPAALELGLVTEVVRPESLDDRVEVLARRVSRLSASTLKLIRKALRVGAEGPVEDALKKVEDLYLEDLVKTADANEGLNAFLEKRTPVWSHR